MELLDCLKEHYQWKNVKFVNETLIETESGHKRLHYWSDKVLLDWHIIWRDHCSDTPYVLLDRMIRSVKQKAAIEWEDGWITVHDQIEQPYPIRGQEANVVKVVAAMIDYGLEEHKDINPIQMKEPIYQELYKSMPYFLPEQKAFLSSVLREADVRMKKAVSLSKLTEGSLPIIDPITSVNQLKKVFNVLFWYGTVREPERGYYSFSLFLKEWLDTFGKESVETFLQQLFEDPRISKDQILLLLSECLKPFELDSLVDLMKQKPTDVEIQRGIDLVKEDWEKSKQLVQIISVTIDKKKVLAS